MPDAGPPPATPTTLSAQEDFQQALLEDDPELLYDRAPCGYLSTTPDGVIVKVNQTLLTWIGLERHELVGRRTFAELLTVGGRIYHETHYAPMLRMQGEARAIALDVRTADGGVLPVLVNAVMERDAEGRPRVVRVVVFDATDRRAYERELLRAKERAEESEARARSLAETLQQTLIPPLPPQVPQAPRFRFLARTTLRAVPRSTKRCRRRSGPLRREESLRRRPRSADPGDSRAGRRGRGCRPPARRPGRPAWRAVAWSAPRY